MDLAPTGDDVESSEIPREDVEMGSGEDEESSEAEVPRASMNPKNPTSREKQEHHVFGQAVDRSWCAACRRSWSWWTTPTVAFDHGLMGKKMQTPFPLVFFRDSRCLQIGATCCEQKRPAACSIYFLSVSSEISWLSQNDFEMRH